MDLEKITKNLEKFGYNYKIVNEVITVKLDFSHIVIISIKSNQLLITDMLKGYNFLTGALEMSLKNSLIYNFIGNFIFGFICLYADNVTSINLNSLYLLFISWVILFSVFYLVKYESFKRQIMNWSSE